MREQVACPITPNTDVNRKEGTRLGGATETFTGRGAGINEKMSEIELLSPLSHGAMCRKWRGTWHPNLINTKAPPCKTSNEKGSLVEVLILQTAALKILGQPVFAVCLVMCHHLSLTLTMYSRVKTNRESIQFYSNPFLDILSLFLYCFLKISRYSKGKKNMQTMKWWKARGKEKRTTY